MTEVHDSDIATEFPEGWVIVNKREAQQLENELRNELHSSHILYGRAVTAMAQYMPTKGKDVLFKVESASYFYYRVHLTWSKERTAEYPSVDGYNSISEFVRGWAGVIAYWNSEGAEAN